MINVLLEFKRELTPILVFITSFPLNKQDWQNAKFDTPVLTLKPSSK